MPSFSRCTLAGHVTKDVEVSGEGDKAFCFFSIAVDVYDPKAENKRRPNWTAIKLYGRTAESVRRLGLKKGDFFQITGAEYSTEEYKGELKHYFKSAFGSEVVIVPRGGFQRKDQATAENGDAESLGF